MSPNDRLTANLIDRPMIPSRFRPFNLLFELPIVNPNHSDRFQWHCDRKLLHNVQCLLTENPSHTPETLIYQLLLTLKQNPDDPLTQRHLYAFLSHVAESVVTGIRIKFEGLPAFKADRVGFIQDLLQDVLEDLLDPVYFFKNFDLDHHSDLRYAALQSYCRKRIKGKTFDRVRQKPGLEDFMRSDLGLARRSSQKTAISAMEYVGYSADRIARSGLAKKCLKEHHQSVKLDISQYGTQEFQQIADRYNQLSPSLKVPVTPIDGVTLKQWLEEIGAAIRQFGSRFNTPQSLLSNDEESMDFDLPDPSGETAYDFSEQQERQAQSSQLNGFLTDCFIALTPEVTRIPLLMHGLSLVQTEIATELGKNQSTIARNYQTLIRNIITQLATWSQSVLHISITSELLSILRDPIEDQLKTHYQQVLYSDFQSIQKSPPPILTAFIHLIHNRLDWELKPGGTAIAKLTQLIQKFTQR